MKNLATGQIRLDHMHVMTLFHRYKPDASPATKQGLVRNISAALEIHAQLEEEIFYPALRESGIDTDVIAKNVPEHARMRQLIGELRGMDPTDPGYDQTFLELMRDVIHHVADEETILLPDAERRLAGRLGDIGKEMSKRRLNLAGSHAGELAGGMAQALPRGAMLLAGGALLAGSYMLQRARSGNHSRRPT